MMLEELYKKGYLQYHKLLAEYSKALGLNAEEAFVLTKILENYLSTGKLSVESLQEQILISSSRVDKVVASLMERGYYEIYLAYDNGVGKECISFRPLFEKLEAILEQRTDLDAYDIEKTNQFLSTKMNRVLTASELEILQGWMVDDHYSYDQIVSVVEKILNEKRVLSFRTITIGLSAKPQEVASQKEAPQVFKEFLKKI